MRALMPLHARRFCRVRFARNSGWARLTCQSMAKTHQLLRLRKEDRKPSHLISLGLSIALFRAAAQLCLALSVVGCHRERTPLLPPAEPPASPLMTAFNYSSEISPASGLSYFLAHNEAELKVDYDRILVHSTGDDPNFTIQTSATSGTRWVFQVDIGSPINTHLEVFYQVGYAPFSTDHMVRSPLKIGRNRLLFELNEPNFTGALRVDPGERAADYSLYSIAVFSIAPVNFVRRTQSQDELAALFKETQQGKTPRGKTSNSALFSIRNAADQANVQPLQDLALNPGANGLGIQATGTDASLLLPEFDVEKGAVARIVIVAPAPTMLQIFYKVGGQIEYDQAHSYTQPIKSGENTVYLHIEANAAGQLRFDPGLEPGKYLLKELEFRALSER